MSCSEGGGLSTGVRRANEEGGVEGDEPERERRKSIKNSSLDLSQETALREKG